MSGSATSGAGGRQRFGIPALDDALGGGPLPGTLTVLAGATGVGKTQFGLAWADAGHLAPGEGRRGVVCDLTSRGDAQNHAGYAKLRHDWDMLPHAFNPGEAPDLARVWDPGWSPGDYFHPFARAGRRVTRRDLEPDDWHAWKTDLARVLRGSVHWLYSHLVRGTRRIVVDGVEPTERFSESIQFEFFEYLYHQVVRKDDDWVARELFRERFRENAAEVERRRYDQRSVGCLYLYTTPHVMLDDLIANPITEGDIFANANTIIYLGRVRAADGSLGRALHVAKHRGSACDDGVHPYRINAGGLEFPTRG